jgi:hypothetical protein
MHGCDGRFGLLVVARDGVGQKLAPPAWVRYPVAENKRAAVMFTVVGGAAVRAIRDRNGLLARSWVGIILSSAGFCLAGPGVGVCGSGVRRRARSVARSVGAEALEQRGPIVVGAG